MGLEHSGGTIVAVSGRAGTKMEAVMAAVTRGLGLTQGTGKTDAGRERRAKEGGVYVCHVHSCCSCQCQLSGPPVLCSVVIPCFDARIASCQEVGTRLAVLTRSDV